FPPFAGKGPPATENRATVEHAIHILAMPSRQSQARRVTMASKYSPEAQGSPILVTTIASAGVLLLLEAMHQLPNIISSFEQRSHSAFVAAIVVPLILILSERMASSSERGDDKQQEGQHD